MKQKDAELIQRILEGDQDAFTPLVNKYQKGVHALAWRKIGDFHIAQEITQDAFLKAYQKLGTLKSYELFGGWLYVIASNLCLDYLRKNPPPEQSLEVTDASEVNQVSYSRYIAGKQTAEADEARREVVNKLLQKLPESERTVMTLHYLGEMTIKTISEFLGVSPNTVKSRLSRARNRLKKEEDMIRQNLGSFQLPTNLTETIMREVSRLVPVGPAGNKPVLPWALSAASAVLIFLLMGVGTQYLSRFQKPYNLNATSEPTVDLIEALFVVDTPAKPAVRNQAGRSAIPGRNPGAGQQSDARQFAAARVDETEVSTPEPQWTQTKGPEGGIVNSLFTTSTGDIYAGTPTSLYKLTADSRAWKHVNMRSGTSQNLQDWLAGAMQLAEHGDSLYFATDTEVLASENNGEAWHPLGTHPEGPPRGFAVTDAGFYLALINGVYHSKDGKTSWVVLKDGMEAEKIRALAAVENTVFAGTSSGLYRLNAEKWELLTVGPADKPEQKLTIHALAAEAHRLYVAAGWELTNQIGDRKTIMTGPNWWSLYRSTDLGDTWYAIDPRKKLDNEREPKGGVQIQFPLDGKNSTQMDWTYANFRIITTKGRVMVADSQELFYSVNAGETWTAVDLKNRATTDKIAPPIVMFDANTFYRGTQSGLLRTTDAGKSWREFNTGLAGATVMDLFAINGKLYAGSMNGFVTSTDGGESWITPAIDGPDKPGASGMPIMETFNNTLYVKSMVGMAPQILRLSIADEKMIPIPGIPMVFEKPVPEQQVLNNDQENQLEAKRVKSFTDALEDIGKQDLENGKVPNLEDIDLEQFNETINKPFAGAFADAMVPMFGNFAVSGETYYVEYKQKLFRWKPGETEWYNTGLVDSAQNIFATMLSKPFDYSGGASAIANMMDSMGFKIAVSGNTVYVARRDGHLSQSFDEGETWNDVTQEIPFSFTEFNAITFAGSTFYVATDKGVAHSSNGANWRAATDTEGNPLVVEKFAVEGATVYGTVGQYVYQLKENSDMWKQVTPEIPDSVLSFVVDSNTLYVGTSSSGVLRFMIEE
ncbi:sigma-70 family RNA polymerase sigma factor [Candidatus Poribacteria bacterium]|nr:sigma-70 family RNA polymerase sigma factor [Candidatus Poribacteria bacterium]MYH79635.1 sigma-70 family RNA polymerase sigma factor [Candidatus Poribacteria bacterium]MYK96096.1 sigma-70 family RNA polymerase sigma factor [Candidatus Poribacteria bacterium]